MSWLNATESFFMDVAARERVADLHAAIDVRVDEAPRDAATVRPVRRRCAPELVMGRARAEAA